MEKKRIVVIDDEVDLCLLVAGVLTDTGLYEVRTAYDGEAGYSTCADYRPDLIFLDFVMPRATGDVVISRLRGNPETRSIPIILISGLGETASLQDYPHWKWLSRTDIPHTGLEPLEWKTAPREVQRDWGVMMFLAKPFSHATLLSMTSGVLHAA